MIRKILDWIYRGSGLLAAVFLFLIFLIIIIQVFLNIIDRLSGIVFGSAIGLSIPSYADIAGYFLAATSFLGLGATFRRGELIRVSLILDRLPTAMRPFVELWCCFLGALISLFASWHAIILAIEAYRFKELSSGIIAIPVWVPQLALILGLLVLSIALLDEFVSQLFALGNKSPKKQRTQNLNQGGGSNE
ncbi:MAG: TRAP transporter small permease [Desulfocapsaceae bacterium]|nr:TRAP transporter small permease [Desulfocapsaceae bacterium]